jgi:hypothetical protein
MAELVPSARLENRGDCLFSSYQASWPSPLRGRVSCDWVMFQVGGLKGHQAEEWNHPASEERRFLNVQRFASPCICRVSILDYVVK